MKRIRFTFKEDGSVTTDAEGFQGDECVRETEKLLSGMNPELKQRTIKGNYHVKQKTDVTIRE